MFNNVNLKLKAAGRFFAIHGIIGSVITGVVLLFNKYLWWIGIIVILGGVLLSWIFGLLLYGYGQLIENTSLNRNYEHLKEQLNNEKKSETELLDKDFEKKSIIKCNVCGAVLSPEDTECPNCGIVIEK